MKPKENYDLKEVTVGTYLRLSNFVPQILMNIFEYLFHCLKESINIWPVRIFQRIQFETSRIKP